MLINWLFFDGGYRSFGKLGSKACAQMKGREKLLQYIGKVKSLGRGSSARKGVREERGREGERTISDRDQTRKRNPLAGEREGERDQRRVEAKKKKKKYGKRTQDLPRCEIQKRLGK